MIKKLLPLLILFLFIAASLQASTTAVIKVRCSIPAIPPINMPALREGGLVEEVQRDNPNFIIQTEERKEDDSRIIFRTVVAK